MRTAATSTVPTTYHIREARSTAHRARGVDLMRQLIDVARVHTTEGEMIGALQEVLGSCTDTPVF